MESESYRTEAYCQEHLHLEQITQVSVATRLPKSNGLTYQAIVDLMCGGSATIVTTARNLALMRGEAS